MARPLPWTAPREGSLQHRGRAGASLKFSNRQAWAQVGIWEGMRLNSSPWVGVATSLYRSSPAHHWQQRGLDSAPEPSMAAPAPQLRMGGGGAAGGRPGAALTLAAGELERTAVMCIAAYTGAPESGRSGSRRSAPHKQAGSASRRATAQPLPSAALTCTRRARGTKPTRCRWRPRGTHGSTRLHPPRRPPHPPPRQP